MFLYGDIIKKLNEKCYHKKANNVRWSRDYQFTANFPTLIFYEVLFTLWDSCMIYAFCVKGANRHSGQVFGT